MTITSFDEMIRRIEEMRSKYAIGQIKLNAQGMYSLIMAGAFDGIVVVGVEEVSLSTRLGLCERVRKALGSTAALTKGDKNEKGIGDLTSELDRKIWVANKNPFFSFRICDEYTDALVTLGFRHTGAANLCARGGNVDLFSNFMSMKNEKVIQYFANKNVGRQPGIVALYQGYETKNYSNGKFIKMKLFDGSQNFEAVIWPIYGKPGCFEPKLSSFIRSGHQKSAIFICRLTKSKGFVNLSVKDIIELG